MSLWDRLQEGFFKNPIAWILLGLLAVAEYRNYERGKELKRLCELTEPHDASHLHPQTSRQEINTICLRRDPETDE
jgi:hypothetical protein